MAKKLSICITVFFALVSLWGCDYREKMESGEIESYKSALILAETGESDTMETSSWESHIDEGEYWTEDRLADNDYTGFVKEQYFFAGDEKAIYYQEDIYGTGGDLKLGVNWARSYDSKGEISEYFSNSASKEEYIAIDVIPEEQMSYVAVNISLKNLSDNTLEMCIADFGICERIKSDKGAELDFPDNRVLTLSAGFDYDYGEKLDNETGFYWFYLEGGQEITTTLCFKIETLKLDNDLYLYNGAAPGAYINEDEDYVYKPENAADRYISLEIDNN